MCNDRSAFSSLDCTTSRSLNLASSVSTEIKGKEHISTSVKTNGQVKRLDCHDVLYVPDLRTNLMSVSKIVDRGHQVNFYSDRAEVICGKSGSVTLVAHRKGDLYYRGTDGATECKNVVEQTIMSKWQKRSLEDWHIRLGYLNVQYLRDSNNEGDERTRHCESQGRNSMRDMSTRKNEPSTFSKEVRERNECR